MHRTGRLLVASFACFLLAGALSLVTDLGMAPALPGLLLLIAAIGSSYLSDFLEGYRGASGE
jgi:hypothetical protein